MQQAALVTHDQRTVACVTAVLRASGYACEVHSTTDALLRGLRRGDYALIVADIGGRVDWKLLLDHRRNWINPSVVVVLVGDHAAGAAALALDAGADDFVERQALDGELAPRLRSAMRRAAPRAQAPSPHPTACRLDRDASSLIAGTVRVELTSREMGMAHMLFERSGELVPRSRMARELWGCDESLIGRSIEQHIYQLRRKLKRCVGARMVLRGVYGSGYRLDVEPESEHAFAMPATRAAMPALLTTHPELEVLP